ncbi:hypothetical protein CTAYLR_010779 [Chrysophaeum taylorii]|uniref:J domain-containing protein n=1 Tax=Chrysophaeum taylorii TaxID=2483200 RepID=A0AAD7U5L2_9STRA|nr:hypothetical protein CTAYLR_010779 [Chrysophaeum taylorii]
MRSLACHAADPIASTGRVAYLKLAKECHPDLHPNNPGATARFQRLSVAYESVKSAAARADYDRRRTQQQWSDFGQQRHTQAQAAATWAEAFQDAEAMFEALQTWWTDETAALEADIADFSTAMRTRRWGDAYVLLQKRSGLIIGVALPLIVLLRWPSAAFAVLRGLTPIITFLIGAVSRTLASNPRLLPLVAGLIHRIAATTWRRMAARARERNSSSRGEKK